MSELILADNLQVLAKTEIDQQISTAKAYPRNLKNCLAEAIEIVSMNQEIAEGCIYSIPRAGKMLTGPSIRLAEIMVSAWTNIHCATRLVKNDGRFIAVEGLVIDREKNIVYSETVERSIMTSGKNGKQSVQYSYDMIQTTAAAAASIALRKAVFRMVKPFVSTVYEHAKKVAIGEAKSSHAKTISVINRLKKMGAQEEKIFDFLGVKKIEEISIDQLESLIGIGTSIKEGTITIEQAFDKTFNPETGEILNPKADEANAKLATMNESVVPSEYERIKTALLNAKSLDTLGVAADLISTIEEAKQSELLEIFYKRQADFNG